MKPSRRSIWVSTPKGRCRVSFGAGSKNERGSFEIDPGDRTAIWHFLSARRAAIVTVALATLITGAAQAVASTGCTALQGSLTTGGLTGSANGTGFSSGDVITVTIVNPSTFAFGDIFDVTTASFRQLVTHTSFSYQVPSNTSDTLNVGAGVGGPGDSVTWS
jgi:hypothetical protein